MMWGVIGLLLLLCALWAWLRRTGRDAAMRLLPPADPFVNRRAMRRYHAALRQKRAGSHPRR